MSGHVCPVCGWGRLEEPPEGASQSFEICPSCGTEFGFHDDVGACGEDLAPDVPGTHDYSNVEYRRAAHLALRRRWIEGGMRWWAQSWEHPPRGWDPRTQLARLRDPDER